MFVVESLDELHNEDYIAHHGIRGMKWGIRRYQNPDGSLTAAGRKRYMKNPKWRAKYLEYRKQQINEANAKTLQKMAKSKEALLKSSNANELYARRNELTTEEIMERVRRLQAEDSLSRYVKKEPTKMEKAQAVINKTLDMGQSIYDFTQKPAGKLAIKQAKKYLGISDEEKRTDYAREIRNLAGLSDTRIKELRDRISNERQLRQYYQDIYNMQHPNRNRNNNNNNNNNNNPSPQPQQSAEPTSTIPTLTADQVRRLQDWMDANSI